MESKASISIGAKDDTGPAFNSIQRSIQKLQIAAATQGKSASAAKLYALEVRGASKAQLEAADSAMKMSAGDEKGVSIGNQIKTSMLAVGAIAATALVATYAAFDQLTKKAGDFQDMAEKTGDTAQSIASLAVAAGTAGVGMETVVSASVRLTKGLTGVDDESKAAGAAIGALGLDLVDFKKLSPADQLETAAKARAKKVGFQSSRHAVVKAVPRASQRVVVRRQSAPISKMPRAERESSGEDAGAEFVSTSASPAVEVAKRGRRTLGTSRKTARATPSLRADGKLKRKVRVVPAPELRDLLPAIVTRPRSVVRSWLQGGVNYLQWTVGRISATVRDIAPKEVDVQSQLDQLRQQQKEAKVADASAKVVHLQPATRSRPTLAQRTPSAVPHIAEAGPQRNAQRANNKSNKKTGK